MFLPLSHERIGIFDSCETLPGLLFLNIRSPGTGKFTTLSVVTGKFTTLSAVTGKFATLSELLFPFFSRQIRLISSFTSFSVGLKTN